MSDNKLVKTIMDTATPASAGSADPSSNVLNYAKFTALMAGSIALKQYLQDQKILPGSV